MRLRIGSWPLAVKLWGAFAALTIVIFGSLAILLPWTLKGFFTEQLYDILLDTQKGIQIETTSLVSVPSLTLPAIPMQTQTIEAKPVATLQAPLLLESGSSQPVPAPVPADSGLTTQPSVVSIQSGTTVTGPSIRHFMIQGSAEADNPEPAPAATLTASASSSEAFVSAMEKDAYAQVQPVAKYTRSIDDRSIFYVIRKEMVQGTPSYLVSYAWGNYRNDLVMTMFIRLMMIMVVLIVLSWLPCLGIARYFTRPLVQMERFVGRMAKRDWHDPVETGRKDEIGRLGRAIESMRQRLVRQDRAQQFFLQHTSHELKTPVMVIRSYVQSIQDGVFPKGTLSASLDVIMKEGERLEKRIRDLLLLNKLNYLTVKEKPFAAFDLKAVVCDVVERLRYRRPEVAWELALAPCTLEGDPEQWKIALENLLDNQLRYAESCIGVVLRSEGGQLEVRIFNDGPPLDEAIRDSLFEPFRTGGDGQFGLGLAIVKQIMDHHGLAIDAQNREKNGVIFTITPR
ncbi:HAMP domain-containing sensor histidine kinase [Paenibacillus oryzisoli]|uniref:HAMP domain-containing sensor histidine kinase n=1 Tax=Paenibacillus oryzisoli TaxID=1850517 RepID=UPI003D2A69F3